MGGPGSGRRFYYGAAGTTSDYRRLDVRALQRRNLLTYGESRRWNWIRDGKISGFIWVRPEPGRVILSYQHRHQDTDWKSKEYSVTLDWTPCHFGGLRAWFICPIQGCSRRVAILYGGEIFACRHCYQLAYRCQRESDYDRAARRADTIRERLGWDLGILNDSGTRPKGMRRETYRRLCSQHDAFVRSALSAIAIRLKL